MSKFNAILAIAAASVLLSGNAFAASLQPAAGEAPFADTVVASSLVQRAEVRAATREAIAHGVRPAPGEQA